MLRLSNFIHLRNYTQFSLSLGALRINELINFSIKTKSPAIGISDKGNLFGAMEFSLECIKNGIQPIISCDLLVEDERFKTGSLLLIINSEEGYKNLSKIVSMAYLSDDFSGKPIVKLKHILNSKKGLFCLSGGFDGLVRKNFYAFGDKKSSEIIELINFNFKNSFFLEIQREQKKTVDNYHNFLVNTSLKNKIPIVATNENYFISKEFHQSHDALMCISQQTYIDSEKRKKVSHECYLKTPNEMNELFSDIPNAIHNTNIIAQKCHFILNEKKPSLPKITLKNNEDIVLKKKSIEGLRKKITFFSYLEDKKKIYEERLFFELKIISEMGYAGYFLIVSDFIQWAKNTKIPVGPGRGSGAGSLVAWCLTITDIDPIRFGLLFERFLNPERISLPDFDIDFCMEKRDEVIKYVQKKYSKDCVAQIITFGSFQARAALRDVGRVLQIPYEQVDKLCKLIPFNPANPITLSEAIKTEKQLSDSIKNNPVISKLFHISQNLEGLLRHASTHAAGLVISDTPLMQILPLYRDPRSNFPVTQFSMKYVEKIGLIKFDFLGLKTLTVIEKTCKILNEKNININLHNLELNDEKTFELLKEGKTIGVFQFDGKGMRETLVQVKPDRFEDLIAIVSLYRPGPMDNIPLYVRRKNSKEQIEYIHEDLSEILDETYGIMVYQEQVMQIVQKLAGFSLSKADLLRRAMGKKIKEEMEAQKQNFISGCQNNNIQVEKAETLFNEIEKFAGYGFNKSHAAAYAMVSYQTAYLKAHYPIEFFCALMECEINNIEKLSVFSKEIKNLGYKIFHPDLNNSYETFKVKYDQQGKSIGILYALGAIKNVGENSVREIVKERNLNGNFESLINFLKRIDKNLINKRQIEFLIYSGSFNSIEENQCFLESNLDNIIKFNDNAHKKINKLQNSLFNDNLLDNNQFDSKHFSKWDFRTKLLKEHESIGFFLSKHPIENFSNFLSNNICSKLSDVSNKLLNNEKLTNNKIESLVIINNIIYRKSRLGNKFAFFNISDETDELEVICFSEVLDCLKNLPNIGDFCSVQLEILENRDSKRISLVNLKKIEIDKTIVNEKILIEINLNDFDFKKFEKFFQNKKGGENYLDFLVKKDELKFLVKTKEKFNIDLRFLNNLKEINGIENIKKIN